MPIKDLVKYFGRDSEICATEDHGMPCHCGTYDSESKRYACSDMDGSMCCDNRVLEMDNTPDPFLDSKNPEVHGMTNREVLGVLARPSVQAMVQDLKNGKRPSQ